MFHTFVHAVKQTGFQTTTNLVHILVLSRVQITKQKSVPRAEQTKQSKITATEDANQ